MTDRDEPISPLRRRMVEDMDVRGFTACTQRGYIRAVRDFTVFFGRSPDQARAEDLRRYQHHMRTSGASATTMNAAVSALRFLFGVTLGRGDAEVGMTHVRLPQRLPVILSPDEVARLLDHAPGLKARAALSLAYGAGLRASEVVSLKVTDIDSGRRVIRVEQGKGRKDRYAILSPDLLALLRIWWQAGREEGIMLPGGWLFPGQTPINHLSTRRLSRIFHAAKAAAEIDKQVSLHTLRHCFATHLLEQKVDIRVIQVLLGHAKLNATAHYSRVDSKALRAVKSPLELLPAAPASFCPCACSRASFDGSSWKSSKPPIRPDTCGSSTSWARSQSRRPSPTCWCARARPTGWSTPSDPSPDPRPCSPISRATPIGLRSPTAASSPLTANPSPSPGKTTAPKAKTDRRS
jgi:site-specific recombinase XerD